MLLQPFLFAALCFAPFSAAQGQTSPTLTPQAATQVVAPTASVLSVEDAVLLATPNNPRITAAVRDVSAASSGVRAASALTGNGALALGDLQAAAAGNGCLGAQ